MNKQKGFTLIELVVVMVILGILAAYAIPKFYDFSSQANIADLNGLAGALNSANVTAHGAALATGQTGATGSITMEGATVGLVFGYPSAAGIVNAMNVSSAFAVSTSGTSTTYTLKTNCTVVYTQATSATTPPTVAVNTGGC
ncbi:type II secretion system protein [Fluoribacter gormanii]|uniref:Pilin n=1 Tax=Fluoribacter gormanii TaxID=464 RepID=A0A377GLY3_9GAMM|nr:type II secretion system protein [Fluoribacter gormanii]KTD05583.1 Tfp pilus assembly protein, major type IV pilin class A [Fluoribacter gormanii]MCW8442633.1 type II secretion system GspH family protein [Fluoribacter gormanii]SIQ68375.1 MSHA pilin protein MshA [Fluoribacter gormanii]STO25758.1 Pilin [Fluoribacter gormanii]